MAGVRRTMVGVLSPSSPALLAPRSASKSLRDQGARSAPPQPILNHTATQGMRVINEGLGRRREDR